MSEEFLRIEGHGPPILGIIQEINRAFKTKNYVCVLLLSRKLLETLLVDLLLKNPGPAAVWVDSKSGHRKTLHSMLDSFWKLMESDFRPFAPQYNASILTQLRNTSWEMKKLGDHGAHTHLLDASPESVYELKFNFQNLIDFLCDMRSKIPETIKFELDQTPGTASSGVSVNVSHPPVLPNYMEWIYLRGKYHSQITFSLEPLDEAIDCSVYVLSKTQAVGFIWDQQVTFKKWLGLRKRTSDIALDCKIEERIDRSQTRAFTFHFDYHPGALIKGKNEVVIEYRFRGKGVKSGKEYDQGTRRISIPVGLLDYAKKHKMDLAPPEELGADEK